MPTVGSIGRTEVTQVMSLGILGLIALTGPIARADDHVITDYGADISKGDDLPAIHRAMAASVPGDRVVIPPGTFQISSAISPKTGTTLIGSGADQSVLEFTGTRESPMISMQCPGQDGVVLSDFTLDGLNSPMVTQGIEASSTHRHKIHRIAVRNLVKGARFGPHGIYFSRNVTESVISNNSFNDIAINSPWGSAIRLSHGSNGTTVKNNTIQNVGRGGIMLDNNTTDCTIRSNTISGSGLSVSAPAIEVWGGSHRCVVEKNTIDHWLSIDSSNHVAVRHNSIAPDDRRIGFAAIEIAGGRNIAVSNNRSRHGQHIGLSISGNTPTEYTTISHNQFTGMQTWGAQLQDDQGGIRNIYLASNTFENTQLGPPKLFNGQPAGIRINAVENGEGIHSLTIDRNIISHNESQGIAILNMGSHQSITGLQITNNRIIQPTGTAITNLQLTESVRWSGNYVDGRAALHPLTHRVDPGPALQIVAPATIQVGSPALLSITPPTREPVTRHALWDFGDGTPKVGENPSHVYSQTGRYLIRVTVWSPDGQCTAGQRAITVVD